MTTRHIIIIANDSSVEYATNDRSAEWTDEQLKAWAWAQAQRPSVYSTLIFDEEINAE